MRRRRSLISVLVIVVATLGSLAGVVATKTTPQLGLDLQGGLSVVLAPANGKKVGDRLNKALDIVRSRVDALGVAEPEIARQGDTIVVDLPGVKEQDRARQIIGKTAELQFRPVVNVLQSGTTPSSQAPTPTTVPGTPTSAPPSPSSTTATTTASTGQQGFGAGGGGGPVVLGQADASTTTSSPSTTTTGSATTTTTSPNAPVKVEPGQTVSANRPIIAKNRDGTTLYQLGPAEVTGNAVKTAQAVFQEGQWEVLVDFTGKGSTEWDNMAARYVQRQVAIVLDGVVQSAPVIQTAHFGGHASITGNFKQQEAKDLALVLRFGALPVELKQISVQEVSATLGRDQLGAGLLAGVVGLALVAMYVLLYYRVLGLVIWMALALTGAALYAIVAWLGQTISLTLTMAGVVGLIVSIGVAVDSNIVYFERLKEELRGGRTVRSAADRAFKAAFRTIVAADFVTILAAALLWVLAIGSVKGFAFYLGLATALDLVFSYFFMHPLVVLIGNSRRLSESRWLGITHAAGAEAVATS